MAFGPSSLRAQESPRIGYVFFDSLLSKAPGSLEAKLRWETQYQQWKAQADSMRQEINQRREEYRTQLLIMTPDRRQERQEGLEKRELEYQQFMERIFGSEGRAARTRVDLYRPIVQRIREEIEAVRQELGYDLILNADSGAIIVAAPSNDLTEHIRKRLSPEGPSPTTEEPARPLRRQPPPGPQ